MVLIWAEERGCPSAASHLGKQATDAQVKQETWSMTSSQATMNATLHHCPLWEIMLCCRRAVTPLIQKQLVSMRHRMWEDKMRGLMHFSRDLSFNYIDIKPRLRVIRFESFLFSWEKPVCSITLRKHCFLIAEVKVAFKSYSYRRLQIPSM